MGGRQRARFAATGSWTACSRRITHAELRRLKTVLGLGPAPRRSALRENRRLDRAEKAVKLNHAVLRKGARARRNMRYWETRNRRRGRFDRRLGARVCDCL